MTPQTADLKAVIQRLEKLETEGRKLKVAAITALTLVGAALVMAQATPTNRTLEAERFVVRGRDGRQRAVLAATDAQGRAGGLLLFSGEGAQPRLSLGVIEESPDITLYSGSGAALQKRTILTAREDGSPGLQLMDGNGTVRVALALTPDGSAALAFNGVDGKPRAAIGVTRGYGPGL